MTTEKVGQQVQVKRTILNTPTIDDPNRKTIQIMYMVGELPPAFIYIPEKEWTAKREAAEIKANIAKRMGAPGEMITL